MVQGRSWEANWFAASQEISPISRNPKVHYRAHKRPPTVSILGQPNSVHIPTYHLLEIHPNIIHPSTPRSPQWSLSLRFPQQDPIPLIIQLHGLRRGSSACRLQSPAETMGSNPTGGMDVCRECCVLSSRGLCDELITRPEETYRLWCVVVCDQETSWMRRPWPTGGVATNEKEKYTYIWVFYIYIYI